MQSVRLLIPVFLLFLGYCPVQGFICPSFEATPDCRCQFNNVPIIRCSGAGLSQSSIDRFVTVVRELNDIPEDGTLVLSELDIDNGGVNFTSLDLTSLIKVSFNRIQIAGNNNLRQIVGPSLDQNQGRIQVSEIYMSGNNLTKDGFGDFFRYLSPESLTLISIEDGLVLEGQDLSNDGEFLPGLSSLSHLRSLALRRNGIRRLGPRSFSKNWALTNLALENNEIDEIAQDAFLQDAPPPGQGDDGMWYINLNSNSLTANSFHARHGLERSRRAVNLLVSINHIAALPRDVFEEYLEAHSENFIGLYENPLVCDSGMKWLKDEREKYESRVFSAQCSNDEGETVFTSSLIN